MGEKKFIFNDPQNENIGIVRRMEKEMAEKSPEELEKMREKYMKRVNGIARERGKSSFGIMKADALNEKAAREDRMDHNDPYLSYSEKMRAIPITDLVIEEAENGNTILKGGLAGKEIEIECSWRTASGRGGTWMEPIIARCTADGEAMDENEAFTIMQSFKTMAKKRTNRINISVDNEKKEQISEKDQKKLEEVREKIEKNL